MFQIYEVVLLEGWVKTSRILSLIENCGSYGFFVFNVFRGSTGISDILIDYAFPVNNEFKIDVGESLLIILSRGFSWIPLFNFFSCLF